MLGNQGGEGGEDELEQNLDGACRWLLSVFPQLVDIVAAHVAIGQYGIVHIHHDIWLHLPVDGRTVDEPSLEAQPHGGCLQQRERELHAGNKAHGERVFGESAHTLLLQEEVAEGLDYQTCLLAIKRFA